MKKVQILLFGSPIYDDKRACLFIDENNHQKVKKVTKFICYVLKLIKKFRKLIKISRKMSKFHIPKPLKNRQKR